MNPGTAGLIARPPVLFLGALLIGFILDRLLGLPFPAQGIHGSSAARDADRPGLATAGIRNFTRAGTPVRSIEPTAHW
jgi:hypothetical protein